MTSARILVVEDNSTVALDLRSSLEDIGYHVTSVVASGEESIEKAEQDHPDAVLMDIRLRDKMDGVEAAGQIYSRLSIPVVFLTAYTDPGLVDRAKRVGSFGYLVKPFNDRELHATLEMALFKARADRALLAEARMEAAATLAAGIAHDYNNLMSVVIGNADLLREDLGDEHAAVEMLNEVVWAGQRASHLAELMLAFAGKGEYQPQLLDLNETVRDFVRLQERALPDCISVKCNLDPELHPIKADRAQLKIALVDIVTNSIEAIEGDGAILIETRNADTTEDLLRGEGDPGPGRYVVLSVKDTGCGMDKEALEKALEPFFSTKFQGRGLGLAAASGIVNKHGGHMHFESEQNNGTTCFIYLSAVESGPKAPAQQPTAAAVKGTETILVVDDQETLLKLTSMMLARHGYKVLTANSQQEAVELARDFEGAIHLVLLDQGIPGRGSAKAFPLLKQARPDLKVLLFSGYDLDATAQALLDAGANGFLKKPVSSMILAEEIRKVLDN